MHPLVCAALAALPRRSDEAERISKRIVALPNRASDLSNHGGGSRRERPYPGKLAARPAADLARTERHRDRQQPVDRIRGHAAARNVAL